MSTKWDTLRRWSTLSASLLAAHNADPSDGTRQLLEDATPSSPCPKLLVINCAPTAACLVGRLGASQTSNCSGSAWGGGGCRPTDPTFCPNCLAALCVPEGATQGACRGHGVSTMRCDAMRRDAMRCRRRVGSELAAHKVNSVDSPVDRPGRLWVQQHWAGALWSSRSQRRRCWFLVTLACDVMAPPDVMLATRGSRPCLNTA